MKSLIAADSHLILALDVSEAAKAREIAESAAPWVDAIKVHWPVILDQGVKGIGKLAEIAPIIVDAKLSDIPNTNRMACEILLSAGAVGVICQGFAGEDSVKACLDAGGDAFVLVEMSHPGSRQFISPHAEEIARMAASVKATGIVAPGNRPEKIRHYREIVGPDLQILCPGIGAQGGVPGGAIASGADFEIVGRSIYQARDPGKAAGEIADAISRALKD
jgi:orotidine-5'-phosphate decarboxylase